VRYSNAVQVQSGASDVAVQTAGRPCVLVIEDEKSWGDPIVEALTRVSVTPAEVEIKGGIRPIPNVKCERDELLLQRFSADLVESGEAALMYSKGDSFDIYIVDLKLQSGTMKDGLALVSAIRRSSKSAGIIVYSGEDGFSTTVPAVVAGANFYLEKPKNAQDLRTATAALWKHQVERQRLRARTFQIGEWTFTYGSRTLVNGRFDEQRLSALEYAFLIHLIEAQHHEIDRATFAKNALGRESAENDRRLDSLKKRLLNKLGDTVQIVQMREHGYKLLTSN
jgi:DNA-binding response OmpR family regulator